MIVVLQNTWKSIFKRYSKEKSQNDELVQGKYNWNSKQNKKGTINFLKYMNNLIIFKKKTYSKKKDKKQNADIVNIQRKKEKKIF